MRKPTNIPAPPPPPPGSGPEPTSPPAAAAAPPASPSEPQSGADAGSPPTVPPTSEPVSSGDATPSGTSTPQAGEPPTLGSEPPTPPPMPPAGSNPNGVVTRNAEQKGATRARDALDRNGDREAGGSLPKDPKARADAVSQIGYEDGREGRDRSPQHRAWSDNEYARYNASYDRGVAQREANELSVTDRLTRLEKATGLPVPNAG